LAARERQPLRHAKHDAGARFAGASEDFGRGYRRGVPVRVGRKIRMTSVVDANAGTFAGARFHGVTAPRYGAAENIEPGTEIADPTGRVRADQGCL
jgi:hypothetical protein